MPSASKTCPSHEICPSPPILSTWRACPALAIRISAPHTGHVMWKRYLIFLFQDIPQKTLDLFFHALVYLRRPSAAFVRFKRR